MNSPLFFAVIFSFVISSLFANKEFRRIPIQNQFHNTQKIVLKYEIKEIDHGIWDQLLKKYVSAEGFVDYKGLKSSETKLDHYLKSLSNNPISTKNSEEEQLAYWLNVYNAFTVKLILDHYPLNSIMEIHNGKAWDKKWIQLGNSMYSLNQIENEIIRPQFKEPRIHFAVNCAAKSCPPLVNEAFTSKNLEFLLEKQTKAFLNNSDFNKITRSNAEISKIFEWYQEDFEDLRAFLNNYTGNLIGPKTKLSYKEYDWSLNGK